MSKIIPFTWGEDGKSGEIDLLRGKNRTNLSCRKLNAEGGTMDRESYNILILLGQQGQYRRDVALAIDRC